MARFTLHAQDLEQTKQLFEEWFDTTGWWNPVALGERLGFVRDDLVVARGNILQTTDEVQATIGRWQASADKGLGEEQLTLLKAVSQGLEQLHQDTALLEQRMDDAGKMLMGQEEAKNIYSKLRQAMEDTEPSSFDELEQDMKSLVAQHQQDLEKMNGFYQTAREELISTGVEDDFDGLAKKCAELEVATGWSVTLKEVLTKVKGLPEDPCQDAAL